MDKPLNYRVFQNQTFENLSGTITCSNFTNCSFVNIGDELVFDRCNLKNCKFNKPCKFVKSLVIDEQIEEGPAKAVKSSSAKTAAGSNDIAINKETTDKALKESIFDKSNYSTIDDNKRSTYFVLSPEETEEVERKHRDLLKQYLEEERDLRSGKYFETPTHSHFVMSGNKGITRGDHLDELYANALIEKGFDTFPSDENADPPYVIDTYHYIKAQGEGKKVLVDLTKILHPEVLEILKKNNIEVKQYYFTMTNIHYLDDEQKVLITDLVNDEDEVNFQCMIDVRNSFGRIAIKLNIDINLGDREEIILKNLDNYYKDGIITSFVED